MGQRPYVVVNLTPAQYVPAGQMIVQPPSRCGGASSVLPLLVGLLLLARVPPELAADAVHPVLGAAALGLDAGEGEAAGRDGDVVPGQQLEPLAAVEAGPGARARREGDAHPQHDGVGQDDGPEGQRVRADGCHQHHRVLRVAERAARREVVRRRARWRRNADAVCQDWGEVFVVAEYLEVGHCWGCVSPP